jgi:hypothetical protein
VKFADIVPSEAEAYELITQARMIIETTKPDNADYADGGSPNMTVDARTFSSNGQNEKIEVGA